MNQADWQQQMQALLDREAIRDLKAAYFIACDGKDPAAMRACFADGEVDIDYGAIGRFTRADDLVAVFARLGCHPHMREMHHGVNPLIELTDADHARGHWTLHYQLIDTREQRLTQLGGYYDDAYRRGADGRWKIAATRSVITSTLVLELAGPVVASVVGAA